MSADSASSIPRFERGFFQSSYPIARIGAGEIGGKASGLVAVRDILERLDQTRFGGVTTYVPHSVVLCTEVYEAFLRRNGLRLDDFADASNEELALAFQAADLPTEVLGDLRVVAEEAHSPLAIRSSSLLEDALHRPFAGVYETKMVANNQPDSDSRFRRLVEAIKFVWSSTWFQHARGCLHASGIDVGSERMAVIIQDVVGVRHGLRFYPDVSGVARSYNFFPPPGGEPGEGVVNLALGLGKAIVDGGVSWIYSPARPARPAPFISLRELLRSTQLRFWAVNMDPSPPYNPVAETEYLVESDLAAAEYDDVLAHIASTYDPRRDRVVPGTAAAGPRVLDFAPLLVRPPLPINDVIRALLKLGAAELDEAVEIEFAITYPEPRAEQARFAVLQLRPMLVRDAKVDLELVDLDRPGLLCAADRVLGNGVVDSVRDVVYVKPEAFEAKRTREIAAEVERFNSELVQAQRPYLLIGFGRWGSADPWLGVPVVWGQVAGARCIVESTLTGMDVEPSQGAHFFHNLIGFQVSYFCVRHDTEATGWNRAVDWAWLDSQPAERETGLLRHVRLEAPLSIVVDGRAGHGAIRLDES